MATGGVVLHARPPRGCTGCGQAPVARRLRNDANVGTLPPSTHPWCMLQPPRSLRHEYAIYLEREIEYYKMMLPRSALLKLADDVVAQMRAQDQLAFDDVLLTSAVDEEIRKRRNLKSYERWRRDRLKVLAQYRRADHWGLQDESLVAEVRPHEHPHVLVAGPLSEERALYLAANGAHVTAVAEMADEELVEKVLVSAANVGLSSQVEGWADGIDAYAPIFPVRAVVWHMQVLLQLSPERQAAVLARLQETTAAGGVHYIEGVDAGGLESAYSGWAPGAPPADGVLVFRKPRVA